MPKPDPAAGPAAFALNTKLQVHKDAYNSGLIKPEEHEAKRRAILRNP